MAIESTTNIEADTIVDAELTRLVTEMVVEPPFPSPVTVDDDVANIVVPAPVTVVDPGSGLLLVSWVDEDPVPP